MLRRRARKSAHRARKRVEDDYHATWSACSCCSLAELYSALRCGAYGRNITTVKNSSATMERHISTTVKAAVCPFHTDISVNGPRHVPLRAPGTDAVIIVSNEAGYKDTIRVNGRIESLSSCEQVRQNFLIFGRHNHDEQNNIYNYHRKRWIEIFMTGAAGTGLCS